MYGLTIDFSLEESVVTKYVDVGADLKLAAGDATCDDCAAAKKKVEVLKLFSLKGGSL